MPIATNADLLTLRDIWNRDYCGANYWSGVTERPLTLAALPTGQRYVFRDANNVARAGIIAAVEPNPRTGEVTPHIKFWIVDKTIAPANRLRFARRVGLEITNALIAAGYTTAWAIVLDFPDMRALLRRLTRWYRRVGPDWEEITEADLPPPADGDWYLVEIDTSVLTELEATV